ESPSFEIIDRLRELGAEVGYHDPYLPRALPVRRHDLKLSSVPLTRETVAGYDAIVISTNHTSIDYQLLAEHARLVVDTRDAMREFRSDMGDRLVPA
ncbi:MAG: hypothetical protein IIB55_06475, partial [Planctomycetes bacterium]|nr:hypothetical protein [Planctomycetota bacterium]